MLSLRMLSLRRENFERTPHFRFPSYLILFVLASASSIAMAKSADAREINWKFDFSAGEGTGVDANYDEDIVPCFPQDGVFMTKKPPSGDPPFLHGIALSPDERITKFIATKPSDTDACEFSAGEKIVNATQACLRIHISRGPTNKPSGGGSVCENRWDLTIWTDK